jgi:hypothetical protein
MTCGSLKCEYDNECIAAIIGWHTDEQCISSTFDTMCPLPNSDIMCTEVYEPVICGNGDDMVDCFYGSLCEATSAEWKDANCTSDNSTVIVDTFLDDF